MNAEEFIRRNPFPENGAEINIELVRDIQNPELIDQKEENLDKLFKVNARLIWLVYTQSNYGESLDSVMSYMFLAIRRASELYDESRKMPFYNYAMRQARALLQNNFNYTRSLIHIPVRRKKEIEHEFTDINDYIDMEMATSPEMMVNDDTDVVDEFTELFELAEKYCELNDLCEKTQEGIDLLLALRTSTIEDVCAARNITEKYLKKTLRKIAPRLVNFRDYRV